MRIFQHAKITLWLCMLMIVGFAVVFSQTDPSTQRIRQLESEGPNITFGSLATVPGEGYMVAGEYWMAVRPPNSSSPNEATQNKRYLCILGCGASGAAWREPTSM